MELTKEHKKEIKKAYLASQRAEYDQQASEALNRQRRKSIGDVGMQDVAKKWLVDVTKWLVVILAAGIVFDRLGPKYDFTAMGRVRCNRITGEVEYLQGNTGDGTWQKIARTRATEQIPSFEEYVRANRLDSAQGKVSRTE